MAAAPRWAPSNGFALHNITEGIGIAAPIARERPSMVFGANERVPEVEDDSNSLHCIVSDYLPASFGTTPR